MDHVALVVGVLIVAFGAVWHLFLRSLDWGLRNRKLVWCVCGVCFRILGWCWFIIWELVGEFGWAFVDTALIRYSQKH
ncbi:hypothetical protein K440DRAFT_222500 [Wilcoxina mikolae CBS 423.85]|nr:hypothetical protein K440DRAFT_222500 [Wilcoxina mikolae CBS 423.85]